MKKSTLIVITLIIGAVLFAFAFGQVDWGEIRMALMLFPLKGLLSIFAINFLAIFLVGVYRWQIILRAHGCRVSFLKVLRAKLAGYTFSYVTPSALIAGEPVRAYMIKEEGCGWEKASASVIIDQLIYLAVIFFVDMCGFLLLAEMFSLPADVVYGFIAVSLATIFVFYVFFKKTLNRRDGEHAFFTAVVYKIGLARVGYVRSKLPSLERTEKIIEGFFREDQKTFVGVVALAFVDVFLNIWAVMATSHYLGYDLGFLNSLGVFSLWSLANLVPIPGALGSSELALAFTFSLLGIGRHTGLVFSLIFRAINITLCLLGVVAFLQFAFKTASKSFSVDAPPLLMTLHRMFARRLRK